MGEGCKLPSEQGFIGTLNSTTFFTMANKIIFVDETDTTDFKTELQTYLNHDGRLYIEIKSGDDMYDFQCITITIEDAKLLLNLISLEING